MVKRNPMHTTSLNSACNGGERDKGKHLNAESALQVQLQWLNTEPRLLAKVQPIYKGAIVFSEHNSSSPSYLEPNRNSMQKPIEGRGLVFHRLPTQCTLRKA